VATLPEEPFAPAAFEGVMLAAVQPLSDDFGGDLGAVQYSFSFRGGSVRWETLPPPLRGTAPFRVFRASENRFLTVIPDRSVITTSPVEAAPSEAGAAKDYHLALVDPKGVIAGVPCERWQASDESYRYEICVAKGLVPFPFHVVRSEPLARILPFNGELMARGLFPLAVTVHPATGPLGPLSALVRFSITQVKGGGVSAELFQIPALEIVKDQAAPNVPRALR
jgi:hypothetical protein